MPESPDRTEQLTVVSNRLPIVMERDGDTGSWAVRPGSGGLVQAMSPILEEYGGNWVGWPGVDAERGDITEPLRRLTQELGYGLKPVALSADEVEGYYGGFANSVLWPLYHGFWDRADFKPEFYQTYLDVNDKFAAALADQIEPGDTVWVHDYHLGHVARGLRDRMEPGRLGYFLHIPFPSTSTFTRLPWRADMMRALLDYDLLGFQTHRDRRNFVDSVMRLVPEAKLLHQNGIDHLEIDGREVWVGAFPIGTDFDDFAQRAASEEVEDRIQLLRRELGPYDVILGIDRLDYTKGLIERLYAYERALEVYPDLRERVVLFQLVVPSRESVPEYKSLKNDVDRIIGRIAGRFSTPSWQPIRYLYNTVNMVELTALYRMASTAFVTPLRDGMNLVSKEYVASQVDESGVLILSEFAGAASQLHEHAELINPHDVDGCADAIHRAVTMPIHERRRRMKAMRRIVSDTDVYWWAREFMNTLVDPTNHRENGDFEYLPTIDVTASGRGRSGSLQHAPPRAE